MFKKILIGSTGSIAAVAVAAGVAIAAGGTSEPASPVLGGPSIAQTPAPLQLKSLSSLGSEAGVKLDTARTVASPTGAGSWTLAETVGGGVCAATETGIAFCELNPQTLAAGRGGAEVYAPDKLLEAQPGSQTARVQPSKEPGVRVGFAPAGVASVSVTAAGGKYATSTVKNGLYSVPVPAQGTPTDLTFAR